MKKTDKKNKVYMTWQNAYTRIFYGRIIEIKTTHQITHNKIKQVFRSYKVK